MDITELQQAVADDLLLNIDVTVFEYEQRADGTVVAHHFAEDGTRLDDYEVSITLTKVSA